MSEQLSALENEFRERLFTLYRDMCKLAGHQAKRLLHMIVIMGPVETVHKIMSMKTTSHTYRLLNKNKCPTLVLEYVLLEPKWSSLFSEKEKEIARRRLKDKNVDPPK